MTAPLFPLEVTRQKPVTIGGKDTIGCVIAEDGLPYVVKAPTQNNPNMAANEWICTRLASACSVPSPIVAILNYNGAQCVGIRIEGGTSSDYSASDTLRIFEDFSNPLALSTVCAASVIDLFLFNPDRHFNNIIKRSSLAGDSFIAIDYSRAFLANWPLPPVVDSHHTATMSTIRYAIAANRHKDHNAMNRVADKLSKINTDSMRGWINEMPDRWLSDMLRSQVIAWFDAEKASRLQTVMEVLDEI